ncbi:MAG: hypothetical protein COV37_16355 [Bdellovibrio sp. CG11_big_fil_rev_8_21_14_0_20_39_38]|nr:MAG: hypothetical protein COW78_02860 [Bdellovibrio sp. CG22_combo_CG10-13_8_21_14_all_39_27]PIR33422.1 MAG: hypothetical protein COV37_16355 [Bdellovibrio sp. CG11_big_fil_rev_8_21_14_0_20_39_38]
MKILAIILIVLGFSDLKAQDFRITRLEKKKVEAKSQPSKQTSGRKEDEELLSKIFENNQRINELLEKRTNIPVIWEQGSTILTGAVFRGTLLNSINSTNLGSPVLVKAHEGQGLAPKTKFSCQGVTQNKRVFTLCNKMITPEKETIIQAQILNRDGTSGLIGIYDDAKEDLIAGAVISDFAQGMLSAAQTRIAGPFGSIRDDSVKNQVLQGLVESGRTTSDILLEDMKTKEPIVTIEAEEEVLIYFMEAVHEN